MNTTQVYNKEITPINYRLQEEYKRCWRFDERIATLEKEFGVLVEQSKNARLIAQNTIGFWKRRTADKTVKDIEDQININTDLRHILYTERWYRT